MRTHLNTEVHIIFFSFISVQWEYEWHMEAYQLRPSFMCKLQFPFFLLLTQMRLELEHSYSYQLKQYALKFSEIYVIRVNIE